ncbi:uncharacterized protein ANIA_11574 [Aspergillus nidulans FGSC A4]|uniref:Uncharacterized protein n=1 Tax=Emericella nidulans (strain FGSC A4 / ATCC 38163 / CBS 112.46 / NRRL 194 / M139) TaxID=227321 RepID=C8VDW6_EMENI|nr:hypothetical protein [Aspergillus nidulans FGSC A4]CBF80214.1 TPA: hypothetical protein ANIA_11574 [Aspergillus nidulans FGSC A4]
MNLAWLNRRIVISNPANNAVTGVAVPGAAIVWIKS